MSVDLEVGSPLLGAAHARVVHGFLLDYMTAMADEPLPIVELDARTGQIGYHLIHRLALLCRRSGVFHESPFIYVMAVRDVATAEHLAVHPWLRPLIERGLLDIAQLDVYDPGSAIALRHSGIEISLERRRATLVLIANRVFGRSARDHYVVEDGQLFRYAEPALAPAENGEAQARLEPLTDIQVYERESWNHLLRLQFEAFDEAAFAVNTAALSWIERMCGLCSHGLLLCTDRTPVDAFDPDPGELSTSFGGRAHADRLDLRTLATFVSDTGGLMLTPSQPSADVAMTAIIYSEGKSVLRETVRAYESAMPMLANWQEWRALKSLIEPSLPRASADQLCAYVGASGWDYRVLSQCVPHLLAHVQADQVSAGERAYIAHAVEQVWSSYFPGNTTDSDIAFIAGVLLFSLGYYERAATFFERSLAHCGESAATYYNLALCAAQLGRHEHALAYVDTALAQSPDFTAAREIRLRVMGGM